MTAAVDRVPVGRSHDVTVSILDIDYSKKWIPLAGGVPAKLFCWVYDNDSAGVGYFRRDAGLVSGSPVQVSPLEIERGMGALGFGHGCARRSVHQDVAHSADLIPLRSGRRMCGLRRSGRLLGVCLESEGSPLRSSSTETLRCRILRADTVSS